MIQAEIQIDTRELNRAIAEAARNSKKTLDQICKRKLLDICYRALRLTKKASKEDIQAKLNMVVRNGGTLADLIVAKQNKGVSMSEQQRSAAVRKFINSRVRAVNFIRVQWAWAIATII